MRKTIIAVLALALAALVAVVAQPASATPAPGATGTPRVLWLWLENKSYARIVGNTAAPYLNSLSASGALLTADYGITHPSAPNYIGATSGIPLSGLPATDCTNCKQDGPSVFTQTLDTGQTWGAYQESMQWACQLYHSADGLYVPRHNPPTYFNALLANSRALCKAGDVPLRQFKPAALPSFTFVTPNLNNDMHNGSIAVGDAWAKDFLAPVLASADYQAGLVTAFVTFDEGSGGTKGEDCLTLLDESCHIPTWVLNANIVAGTRITDVHSHYDMLATTEDLLGLPALGQGTSYKTALGL